MSSCPTCGRIYEDETIRFCLDDGSPLPNSQPEPTLRMSAPVTGQAPTLRSTQPAIHLPGPSSTAQFGGQASGGRGRGLLWIAVALIIGGSAIAVAFILTRGRQTEVASVSPAVSSPSPNLFSTKPESSSTVELKMGQPTASPQSKAAQPTPQIKTTPPPRPTPEKIRSEQPAPTENAPPAAPRAPISGGVLNGKATHLVQPTYPPIARSAHASGTVTVQVLVDENGSVIAAHAVSGHPLLQASAVNAARSSKFSPTKLSGQPVKVNGVIVYNFVAQ